MLPPCCRTVSGTCRSPEQQQSFADRAIDTVCFEGNLNNPQERYVMQELQGFAYFGSVSDTLMSSGREQVITILKEATHVLCTIPPSPQDTLVSSSHLVRFCMLWLQCAWRHLIPQLAADLNSCQATAAAVQHISTTKLISYQQAVSLNAPAFDDNWL